jgi:regulatory protein NPR1
VAFARIFFPSEAKLAMCIAEADSTEEFTGATLSKLKEVGLSEVPTMQNRRLRQRLDALSKTGTVSVAIDASFLYETCFFTKRSSSFQYIWCTCSTLSFFTKLLIIYFVVELGRRYFPNCSAVLDKFLHEESNDLALLEGGTSEDQQVKRKRFYELKEDVREAFDKDMAASAAVASTASSSSSPRYEGRGKRQQALRKGSKTR